MLYRALSLSFLLSTILSAGDTPPSRGTVEMANKNPSNKPQMPWVDFKQPHTGGDGGIGGSSSSDVGSTTGGSIINAVKAFVGPSAKELERDREIEELNKQLTRAMTKSGTNQIIGIPRPDEYYIKDPGAVKGFAPAPQPTPKVSAPVTTVTPAPAISTTTPVNPDVAIHVDMVPVVSAPISVATSAPAASTGVGDTSGNTSLVVPQAPPAAIVGKSPFVILNRDKVPTLNEMTPPLAYTKPMPTPQPVESAPSSTYAPAPAPSDSFQWGKVLQDAGEGAAIAVGAIAITYAAFKTGEGIYKGSQWLWKNTFGAEAHRQAMNEAAMKQQVQEVLKQYPNAVIEPHGNSNTAFTVSLKPKSDFPAYLQPSDNPLKLGKKITQPGPKPGQGNNPHGYKDQWGHYRDYTPENVRAAIESVEKGMWHGQNPTTGKHIFTYDCPKTGLQKWAEVGNNGEILNCGINEVRYTVCPQTKEFLPPAGFKKPSGKNTGWVDKSLKIGVISTALSSQYTSSTPLMIMDESLPTISSLPPAPRDITVHDLEAERRTKNHYVAMEQKKVEVIQNKIHEGSNL